MLEDETRKIRSHLRAETVGIETMQRIKNRIREGIIQQEQADHGNGHH